MNGMVSQEVQALGVRDRVVTSLGRVLQVSGHLTDDRAREHLKHGLARRLCLLHLGIAEIVAIAHPRGRELLSDVEQLNLALHLNSFYLHIRGCLGNLAWCLAHELKQFGSQIEEERVASKVNLLAGSFLGTLTSAAPGLAVSVRRHTEWHRDLKSIRDPAGQLSDELNGIGDYMPSFAHSPSVAVNLRKVYPQVGGDLLIVLELLEDVVIYLEQRDRVV